MSNIATQTTIISGARAVGSKNQAGEQFGGIYYPAHSKNGKPVSARWEGNIAMNGKGYTDSNGQSQEGETTFIKLVVWNGKNAQAGKGLADTFAKCISVGKELGANCRLRSYQKRMFHNGQPLCDPQGNVIMIDSICLVFKDDLVFGDDSNKVILDETSRYDGNPSFGSRPPMWNVLGNPDQVKWAKEIVPARMAVVWDGQADRYGYARVIVPEGAIIGGGVIQQNNNQATPINTGTTPTDAAAQLGAQGTTQQVNTTSVAVPL